MAGEIELEGHIVELGKRRSAGLPVLRPRRTRPAIVRNVLALAADLGLGVTAEGIETEAQRTRLLDLGCQLGQGSARTGDGATPLGESWGGTYQGPRVSGCGSERVSRRPSARQQG